MSQYFATTKNGEVKLIEESINFEELSYCIGPVFIIYVLFAFIGLVFVEAVMHTEYTYLGFGLYSFFVIGAIVSLFVKFTPKESSPFYVKDSPVKQRINSLISSDVIHKEGLKRKVSRKTMRAVFEILKCQAKEEKAKEKIVKREQKITSEKFLKERQIKDNEVFADQIFG